MVAGGRISPFALIAALVVMILALVYVAFNRSHAVVPHPPMHQSR